MQHNPGRNLFGAAILAAALVSGCASKPPNAQLEESRAVFERVQANELVETYAAAELAEARTSLARATKMWKDKVSKSKVNHAAYLARQKVLIAQNRATALHAKEQNIELNLEHSKSLADLKSSEANLAREQAAEASAHAIRLSAEAKRLELEVADREAALQSKLEEIAELKELQARQTDRGMVLTLGDVLFDSNKSTLKSGAIGTLDKVSAFMHKYPQRKVLIEGHTDNVGDEGYNRELSINRALAIQGALAARGIGHSRIDTEGLGESAPVASNSSSAGRQLNRRVEMIFENQNEPSFAAAEE